MAANNACGADKNIAGLTSFYYQFWPSHSLPCRWIAAISVPS